MFIQYLPYNWKTERFLVKRADPHVFATSKNKADAWWFISHQSCEEWCDERNALEGNRHWVVMRSIETVQENSRITFQRSIKGGR